MSLMQNFNDPDNYSDTTFDISSNTNTEHNTIILGPSNNFNNPQETVGSNEYSFFYKPPNDFQIYNITCKEIQISFELVSQLLSCNSNNNYYDNSNNLHVFHFLKHDEEKCYKITCELISHSSIIQYLNKNIYGIEVKQTEHLQQECIEFSTELKENLEFYLNQFFIHYLGSK